MWLGKSTQAQKAAGEESSCGMADADARMAALTEEVSLAHAERARALDVQLAAASELEEQLECSRVRDAQVSSGSFLFHSLAQERSWVEILLFVVAKGARYQKISRILFLH